MTRWVVSTQRGSTATVHALDPGSVTVPHLWVAEADDRAIVLGSAQADDHVDRALARAAGLEVVRRRSGGGAVLIEPGDVLWVDVVIPRDDALWDDDVGRAFHWLGEVWVDALAALGTDAHMHAGAMIKNELSPYVCFAGVGPGEVLLGDAKVVGISQRRTRTHARFQCALLLRWDPGPLVEVMPDLDAERHGEALARCAVALDGVDAPAARAAFVAALTAR